MRSLDAATTWRASLPNSTPRELVRTLAALVDAEDFVSVYLLLDAPAQREVAALLPPGGTDANQVTAGVLDDVLDDQGFAIDFATVELGRGGAGRGGIACGRRGRSRSWSRRPIRTWASDST